MISSGLTSWREGDSSRQWFMVTGKIRSAVITPYQDRQRIRYRINIIYTYNIGTVQFESGQIHFNALKTCDSEQQARQFMKNYQEGAEVAVYVNPADPHQAVLKPGRTAEGRHSIDMGAALVLLGLFLLGRNFLEKEKMA